MMPHSPADSRMQTTPTDSMPPGSLAQVHQPYAIVAATRNTPTMMKIRASIRIGSASLVLAGLARGPVGVEGVGGHRAVRLVDCLQRLALPVRIGAPELVQRGEVGLVLLPADRPHLEVHLRMVGAAQLGAATDERSRPVDGDLELVVHAR